MGTFDHQANIFIVFHEFTKTALAMGITLNTLGIPFVYLNGKVTAAQKNKAIAAFQNNKDVKVMVRLYPTYQACLFLLASC